MKVIQSFGQRQNSILYDSWTTKNIIKTKIYNHTKIQNLWFYTREEASLRIRNVLLQYKNTNSTLRNITT